MPESISSFDRTKYKDIIIVTDRLGKGRYLIKASSITAEYYTLLFLKYVFKYYGLPRIIVSDRGT